jgi:hypothetical protein
MPFAGSLKNVALRLALAGLNPALVSIVETSKQIFKFESLRPFRDKMSLRRDPEHGQLTRSR